MHPFLHFLLFFFFNDTATTEIYTLSLHDALPIYLYVSLDAATQRDAVPRGGRRAAAAPRPRPLARGGRGRGRGDRKSTRLNSSHGYISYAVFCLKKKKKQNMRSSRGDTRSKECG